MSKLSAIYSALDNGNPRSALRLCQQALSKSNSQLVRALMALAHSRLDQSEEALSICEALAKAGVSDTTVVETIGYVYRREGRFDLLSNLFASAINHADQTAAIDMSRQAYIAGVQSSTVDSLSTIAAKLVKLTNEKNYYAWASFALYLKALNSEDRSSKLTLALAMLEKAETEADPNPEGKSRTETCARMHAYLNFFKIMIFVALNDRWSEIDHIIRSGIKSGLISEDERKDMLSDIEYFSHSKKTLEKKSVFPVEDKICALAAGECTYEDFINVLKDHIRSCKGRSDCVVTTAPFLAVVRDPSDLMELLQTELDACEKSDIEFLNISKLIYGLSKEEVDVSFLMSRALSAIAREDDLDECSPGKQMLLLSAIVLLENESKLLDCLAILDYGSTRFKHCSHFRLVQSIVYTRLGLMARGIERFEALGIKNAQWRSLFWLIESPLREFFSSEKLHLFEQALEFFRRNKTELQFAIASLVEQGTFFKYHDFADEIRTGEESGVRKHILREMNWHNVLEGSSLNMISNYVDIAATEYDFAPLLFINMPKINSLTADELSEKIKAKRRFPARACGFRWPLEEAKKMPPRLVEISEERVLGRLISRPSKKNESRDSLIEISNHIASGIWEAADLSETNPLVSGIVKLVLGQKRGTETSDFEPLQVELTSLAEIKIDVSDWKSGIQSISRLLNGNLQTVVFVCERAAVDLPKKSGERKVLKQTVNVLRHELDVLIKEKLAAVRIPEILVPDLPAELNPQQFMKKLENDIAEEKAQLRAELERLSAKLKNIKF